MAFRSGARCSPSSTRLRRRWALRPSNERIDPLRGEAELCGRGADFPPGFVIHRDAIAFALRARFAFGLAGDAHAIEARRRRRFADPIEVLARFTLERVPRAQLRRIDQYREHAVQHATLGAFRIVPGAACRERPAQQLAGHRKAVALVPAEGLHGPEGLYDAPAWIVGRIAFAIEQPAERDLRALVVRHAKLSLRDGAR